MSTITVKEEVTAYELGERLWQGGLETWKEIEEADKEGEAMQYISEVFCDRVPDIMEINDLLWMDRDNLFEAIGMADKDIRERELVFNEEDLDTLKEDVNVREDITQKLSEMLEERKPILLVYTSIKELEEELGREFSDDEMESLNDLGYLG